MKLTFILVPCIVLAQTFTPAPPACSVPNVPFLDATASVCPATAVHPPGQLTPPPAGATYVDPLFGATVRVATGRGFIHTYSTPSALSATGKHVATGDAGASRIFRVADGTDLGKFGPSQDWGFWWHTSDDSKFFTLESDKFYARDLAGAKTLVLNPPALGLTSLRTGGTGDLSRDHWVAFWAGAQVCIAPLDSTQRVWCVADTWSQLKDFLLISKGVDAHTGKRYVAIENSGVVLQFDGQALTLAYVPQEHPDARTWSRGDGDGICEPNEWCKNAQWDHADTVEIAGAQYIWSDYETESGPPNRYLALYDFTDPTTTPVRILSTGNHSPYGAFNNGDTHFSCARTVPVCSAGFTYRRISIADYNAGNFAAFDAPMAWNGELMAFDLSFTPVKVSRLAQNRSVRWLDFNEDYASMTKASISPDGQWIAAISNFGYPSTAYPGTPADTRRDIVVATKAAPVQPPPPPPPPDPLPPPVPTPTPTCTCTCACTMK